MAHKSPDQLHTIWYIGETIRTAGERFGECYPAVLERFGVTHKMVLASIPDGNSRQTRLIESFVAGTIQEATNMTRGTSSSFFEMSNVNRIHAGDVDWGNMNGHDFCRWMARYCPKYGDQPVIG